MTTIYFVRHGQASFGAESYDKLSDKGEIQAQFLGQYLAEILKQQPYVVAGSMLRHQQTAQFALSQCFADTKIHTDARWTGGEYQDYDESWQSFKGRIESALHDLFEEIKQNKPRYVVVFSSGGVISVLTGLLLGLSEQKTFELNWSVVNTSLTTVRVAQDQKPQLVSFNEHHFIKAKHPELLTWI